MSSSQVKEADASGPEDSVQGNSSSNRCLAVSLERPDAERNGRGLPARISVTQKYSSSHTKLPPSLIF